MKNVLLTGACGFIGANLARTLLGSGHTVHLLVRPGSDSWRIDEIRSHVQLHELNLLDESALVHAVEEIKPDWVFHLAAHGAYSHQTDVHEIIRTNFLGTVNLVEACLKIGFESFVNAGSSSEYGLKNHAPSETEWIEPNSHYAVSKASATLYCRYTAISHRVPITTLRLYSVYGPYEEPTRLIPTLLVRGLDGQWPPMANRDIARDYVYVDDVCDALLVAASDSRIAHGSVYNIGTGTQTTLEEVVDLVRELLGVDAPVQWGSMPPRSWDTDVWVADSSRIRQETGWQFTSSLENGLAQFKRWIEQNPSHLKYYREVHGRS